MKCWIDGSVCLNQRESNFGLFNISTTFCQECQVLVSNLEDIGKVFERMGIEGFQVPDPIINEDNQDEVWEHAGIILASLGLLKKEINKKSKKREISLKQIAILNDISGLSKLFKTLRKNR